MASQVLCTPYKALCMEYKGLCAPFLSLCAADTPLCPADKLPCRVGKELGLATQASRWARRSPCAARSFLCAPEEEATRSRSIQCRLGSPPERLGPFAFRCDLPKNPDRISSPVPESLWVTLRRELRSHECAPANLAPAEVDRGWQKRVVSRQPAQISRARPFLYLP
jgi:hypothetical protein